MLVYISGTLPTVPIFPKRFFAQILGRSQLPRSEVQQILHMSDLDQDSLHPKLPKNFRHGGDQFTVEKNSLQHEHFQMATFEKNKCRLFQREIAMFVRHFDSPMLDEILQSKVLVTCVFGTSYLE